MKTETHTTVADWVLIGLLLFFAAILFFLLPGWVLSGGTTVEIRSGEKFMGRYSLHQDRRVSVPGPLGATEVEIRDGRARVTSSPCPHKTCVRMGEIGSKGGLIACVPNKVVVKVGRGEPEDLDAVSR
jgi:hypothetical protein